ncbi:MAG: translation elongation factor Ts [Paludibacteraceae bacterium]|nr:translation elongation factor Ts [Paludibacteraceae bacterium]
MAVSMSDIKKLRDLTNAGMMDCKNALTEANGDMEQAIALIRKRGQAIAAKRSDREASEGCVLAGVNGDFACIVAIKCETDFVAKNADFIALTKKVLDLALANKVADKDALLAATIDGRSVAELIAERSGVTGEKMEMGAYEVVAGASTVSYIHPGNKLATVIAFNEAGANVEAARGVAMHVAAMAPAALDEASIPQATKDSEREIAIEKTKKEEVDRAVEQAIRKAGINPNHVDSDDHISSNVTKGYLTQEQADQARQIIATVSAEAAANINMTKVEKIVDGRMSKFFKECTLVNQKYEGGGDDAGKITVKEFCSKSGISVKAFKRFTLNEE